MKKLLAFPLLALTLACVPSEPIELSAEEQSELSEALRGRVAETPTSCVSSRDLRGNRSVGEGVIIFDGIGDRIYVNRPAAGCPELGISRALVTRSHSSQLCRGDIATVVDTVTGTHYGGCALGAFTPYRRAD